MIRYKIILLSRALHIHISDKKAKFAYKLCTLSCFIVIIDLIGDPRQVIDNVSLS